VAAGGAWIGAGCGSRPPPLLPLGRAPHFALDINQNPRPACPAPPPSHRRALKTKGNTPKYGLIFHSSFIGRAKQRNKGRISRYLANKCSIASRIDAFMDATTSAFGEKLKEQVRHGGGACVACASGSCLLALRSPTRQ
jgi:hypothetical protein